MKFFNIFSRQLKPRLEDVTKEYFLKNYKDKLRADELKELKAKLKESSFKISDLECVLGEDGNIKNYSNEKDFQDFRPRSIAKLINKCIKIQQKHRYGERYGYDKNNLLLNIFVLGVCRPLLSDLKGEERLKQLAKELRPFDLDLPFLWRYWDSYLYRNESQVDKNLTYLLKAFEHATKENTFSYVDSLGHIFFDIGKTFGKYYIRKKPNNIIELIKERGLEKLIDPIQKDISGLKVKDYIEKIPEQKPQIEKCPISEQELQTEERPDYDSALKFIINSFIFTKEFFELHENKILKEYFLGKTFYELGNFLYISRAPFYIINKPGLKSVRNSLKEKFSIDNLNNMILELFHKAENELEKAENDAQNIRNPNIERQERILSYLGSTKLKLSEFYEDGARKEYLERAVRDLNEAKELQKNGKKEAYLWRAKAHIELGKFLFSKDNNLEALVGYFNLAREDLAKVCKFNENWIFPYCLMAEMSDFVTDKRINDVRIKEINKYGWTEVIKKVIEKISKNKGREESRIEKKEIKEKVCFISDEHGLVAHDLIIKENRNEKKLKEQFLIDNFIYKQIKQSLNLDSDSVPFSRPLDFRKSGDKFYYTMRRSKGLNLDKKFKFFRQAYSFARGKNQRGELERIKNEEQAEIRSTLKNFAKFHGILVRYFQGNDEYKIYENIDGERIPYEIKKFDYLENIVGRAVVGQKPEEITSLVNFIEKKEGKLKNTENYERLGYNDALIPFLKSYKNFINEHLLNIPFETILHRDAYPTNVLESGIIIDPKPLCRGNPMLDISHFLISPRFEVIVDNFVNEHSTNFLRSGIKIETSKRGTSMALFKELIGQDFVGEYLNFLQEECGLDNNIKTKLKNSYLPHIIHNGICLAGALFYQGNEYNKSDDEKMKKGAQRMMKDARYCYRVDLKAMETLRLNDLKNSFVKYMENSKLFKDENWNRF